MKAKAFSLPAELDCVVEIVSSLSTSVEKVFIDFSAFLLHFFLLR